MKNVPHLGMETAKKPNLLTREKILRLIKGNLSQAKVLYATREELLNILLNEKRENFLSETERLNNQTIDEKIDEIFDFINSIAQKLDEKQAIVALQTGLSLLNKNRKESIIPAKKALLEDGIFGEKTKASLYESCKYYNSRVIKKYILMALLNNIVFNTKDEIGIDTEKLIHEAKISLEEVI